MSKCVNCGADLKANTKFCTECGASAVSASEAVSSEIKTVPEQPVPVPVVNPAPENICNREQIPFYA